LNHSRKPSFGYHDTIRPDLAEEDVWDTFRTFCVSAKARSRSPPLGRMVTNSSPGWFYKPRLQRPMQEKYHLQ